MATFLVFLIVFVRGLSMREKIFSVRKEIALIAVMPAFVITIAMLIWGGSSKCDTDLNHIIYMTPQ